MSVKSGDWYCGHEKEGTYIAAKGVNIVKIGAVDRDDAQRIVVSVNTLNQIRIELRALKTRGPIKANADAAEALRVIDRLVNP